MHDKTKFQILDTAGICKLDCADTTPKFPQTGHLSYHRYSLGIFCSTHFIALIHPIQWTIANRVGADRPAKRQKKTSCVSTGHPVPVLCTLQMVHRTSFLSRQRDVIASFSFGAWCVHTYFHYCQIFIRYCDYFENLNVSAI